MYICLPHDSKPPKTTNRRCAFWQTIYWHLHTISLYRVTLLVFPKYSSLFIHSNLSLLSHPHTKFSIIITFSLSWLIILKRVMMIRKRRLCGGGRPAAVDSNSGDKGGQRRRDWEGRSHGGGRWWQGLW